MFQYGTKLTISNFFSSTKILIRWHIYSKIKDMHLCKAHSYFLWSFFFLPLKFCFNILICFYEHILHTDIEINSQAVSVQFIQDEVEFYVNKIYIHKFLWLSVCWLHMNWAHGKMHMFLRHVFNNLTMLIFQAVTLSKELFIIQSPIKKWYTVFPNI